MKLTSVLLLMMAIHAGFAQSSNTKAETHKVSSHDAEDTWERSKECAAQSEKTMAARDRGAHGAAEWTNHYSPKYKRCFIKADYLEAIKDGPFSITILIDAFERSGLAASCTVLAKADCVEQMVETRRREDLDSISKELNGKPYAEANSAEQEAARNVQARVEESTPYRGPTTVIYCNIEGKAMDCSKAAEFIDEHMKN